MLSFLSSTGLIPDAVIRQAVHELGEPQKPPDARSMTTQVEQRLRACQQQTNVIAGFLTQTGMTLEPEPP